MKSKKSVCYSVADNTDTFRIGVIGEIYEEDVLRLTEIMKSYMEQA